MNLISSSEASHKKVKKKTHHCRLSRDLATLFAASAKASTILLLFPLT